MTDHAAGEPVEPGHTAERVAFFTDAVFAIAMTLLVIEIPRPDAADFGVGPGVSKVQAFDHLWQFLAANRSAFYSYALAFWILWVIWRQHHMLFDQISHVSGAMVGWQLPMLLLVAFIPYATTVMGHYSDNPLAALLFGLSVGIVLLCRSVMQARAARDHVLLPEVDEREFRAHLAGSWAVTGYWVLSLVLVWWAPWGQIAWFLTPAVGSAGDRVAMRRIAADEPDES
jgi:uncharacterized membrane protein